MTVNKVIIKGRITKDLELRYTTSNTEVLKFTLAVKREYKNGNNEYDTDFINCTAFKNNAIFISKYFEKGSEMILEGKIQTGSYDDKDGNKKYTTDVIVDRAEFCGSKNKEVKPKDFVEEENVFESFGKEIDDNFLD